jgi:4-hydroxyphenylacetate 3-monooxygenase
LKEENMSEQVLQVSKASGPLLERVDAILPAIRERAEENEQARQLIDSNFDDLLSTGIFRSVVPKEFGGLQTDIREYLEAIRRISSADPSTGWVAGLVSVHGHGLAYFDRKLREEVWANGPDATLSTSGPPSGTAEVVDGGIRISGRWRFSSGIDRALWAMVGILVPNAQTGEQEFFLVAVPRDDFTIDDTWHVSGLRATGSNDVVIDGAFVPRYRWAGPGFDNISPPYPTSSDSPLYSVPFLSVFAAVFAAVALGAAEGGLAVAEDELKVRVRPQTGERSIESPAALMRLGKSALQIRAAAALIERHWGQLADATRTGEPVDATTVGRWKSEDAYGAWLAIGAIDRLINGAGGTAQFSKKPLQRYWRDLHTIGAHVYLDFDANMELAAREQLGIRETSLMGEAGAPRVH